MWFFRYVIAGIIKALRLNASFCVLHEELIGNFSSLSPPFIAQIGRFICPDHCVLRSPERPQDVISCLCIPSKRSVRCSHLGGEVPEDSRQLVRCLGGKVIGLSPLPRGLSRIRRILRIRRIHVLRMRIGRGHQVHQTVFQCNRILIAGVHTADPIVRGNVVRRTVRCINRHCFARGTFRILLYAESEYFDSALLQSLRCRKGPVCCHHDKSVIIFICRNTVRKQHHGPAASGI